MRSRTSRGVPEWSGGEELYMGSPVSFTGTISGVIGIVPGPPKGARGSTGWGHLPRGTKWAEQGREPAHSGLVRPPKGPKEPRAPNPRVWGLPPTKLGGQASSFPLVRLPPSRLDLEGLAPFPFHPINRGEEGGQQHHIQGAALPLSHLSSSSVELGEALQENHELHHHAVVLPEFFPNFSYPLAGSRRRRRPRAVRVLNAEASLFGAKIGINNDLNSCQYEPPSSCPCHVSGKASS